MHDAQISLEQGEGITIRIGDSFVYVSLNPEGITSIALHGTHDNDVLQVEAKGESLSSLKSPTGVDIRSLCR